MACRIRTVVVEDQPIARDRLVEMLRAEPDIDVVALRHRHRSGRGHSALSPDLVLLDLQMPDLDGFEIIAELGDAMPLTIFVTAYDEYALKAFEVHAFDYLLKPFGRERFHQAVARARTRLTEGREEHLARRFVSLVHDAGSAPAAGPADGEVRRADDAPAARRARRRGVRRQLRAAALGRASSGPRHHGRHRGASGQRSLLPHPSRLDRQPRPRARSRDRANGEHELVLRDGRRYASGGRIGRRSMTRLRRGPELTQSRECTVPSAKWSGKWRSGAM